ncbi:MAG: 6-hydroxymethylpterin diphosphokinase MptE-like protein [Aeromicrobium sp.]
MRISGIKVTYRSRVTPSGRRASRHLASMRNRHLGARCVVVGNGPSLNETPLNLLEGEFVFGLNRLYMMFGKLGFESTYHVVVNKHVVEQCADDFNALRVPLFTTRSNHPTIDDGPQRYFLEDLTGPQFSRDASHGIWQGSTVTYVAMQLAYFMGFSKVILIGVDHNFTTKGTPHQLVESRGTDSNHFDPNYFGKGFRWQLPDLETSEVAYQLAREAFERDGREIVDATVGGKLTVFRKGDLETELHG